MGKYVRTLSQSNLWGVDLLMILVTLGTQDKPFYRLLEAIQNKLDNKKIKDDIIVQAGCSKNFKTKSMKMFDLIPIQEFDKLISECDILITHGGVGSIITGLKNNKKVIAAARLKKYKEHTNDHQLQIIKKFKEEGYILELENFNDIDKVLKKAETFIPKKYKSNTKKFINLVEEKINS